MLSITNGITGVRIVLTRSDSQNKNVPIEKINSH